jgi:hypothetical protein
VCLDGEEVKKVEKFEAVATKQGKEADGGRTKMKYTVVVELNSGATVQVEADSEEEAKQLGIDTAAQQIAEAGHFIDDNYSVVGVTEGWEDDDNDGMDDDEDEGEE